MSGLPPPATEFRLPRFPKKLDRRRPQNGAAAPASGASRIEVAPKETTMAIDQRRAEEAVREILRQIGEDPAREGLERTPARVVEAFRHLTRGYSQDPKQIVNGALFTEEGYSEMILCKDVDFYSLCEHHLLPFMGK